MLSSCDNILNINNYQTVDKSLAYSLIRKMLDTGKKSSVELGQICAVVAIKFNQDGIPPSIRDMIFNTNNKIYIKLEKSVINKALISSNPSDSVFNHFASFTYAKLVEIFGEEILSYDHPLTISILNSIELVLRDVFDNPSKTDSHVSKIISDYRYIFDVAWNDSDDELIKESSESLDSDFVPWEEIKYLPVPGIK